MRISRVSAFSLLATFVALSPARGDLISDGQAEWDAHREQSAISIWTKATEQGDSEADTALGNAYSTGRIPVDYAAAIRWYRLGAERGNAHAQSNLGLMYLEGQGVAANREEGAKWLQKAADQGDGQAAFNRGLLYEQGDPAPQDFTLARHYFTIAAQHDNADAQANLANYLLDGKGGAIDPSGGWAWLNTAANRGSPLAEYNLGKQYLEGKPPARKDVSLSLEWLTKAAMHGNPDAVGDISTLYEEGKEVPKDYTQSLKWAIFLTALKSVQADTARQRDALGMCEYLAQNMTKVQISDARRQEAQLVEALSK
jgi:TPR repeat protein